MNPVVNVSVIYHSTKGAVAEIAREVSEAAGKSGADVRLRRIGGLAANPPVATKPAGSVGVDETADIPVADLADLLWADALIMGSPTRFGNVSAEYKLFIDTLGDPWRKGLLANKVYSAFTATSTPHGGQEATLLAMMTSFHHFGGIVVAPGYTGPEKFVDGNPYGTAHCTVGGSRPVDETTRNAARVQAERVVRVARSLKAR